MDDLNAKRANELTKSFYATHAQSFSETRQRKWDGWDALCDTAGIDFDHIDSVLDIACGNMRFLTYLESARTHEGLSYYGVDCTQQLVACARTHDHAAGTNIHFQRNDLIDPLLGDDTGDVTASMLECPPVDLVCIFGFMHHVPTQKAARHLLELAYSKTKSGGFIAASFWQPLDDDRLRSKAIEASIAAADRTGVEFDIDARDAFLSWQDDEDVFRFCHHFNEDEIDALSNHMQNLGCEETCRYFADGRSGKLNRYIVWTKR